MAAVGSAATREATALSPQAQWQRGADIPYISPSEMGFIYPPAPMTLPDELAVPTVPAAPMGTALLPSDATLGTCSAWQSPQDGGVPPAPHGTAWLLPRRTPQPAADSAINHGDTSSGQDGGDDRDHPSACHPR